MNVFFALPVPAGNGTGASVDAEQLGSEVTILLEGDLKAATINIEASDNDVDFATVASFARSGMQFVEVAGRYMRVKVSGYKSGVGSVFIGGPDLGTLVAALPVPAAPGVGAAVDVSAMNGNKSVTVVGTFQGSLNIEVSDDDINYVEVLSFTKASSQKLVNVVCKFLRVQTSKGAPGVVCTVSAERDAGVVSNVIPPPFAGSSEIVIYARTTGSNTTGNGTLANPYATFQRAVEDVPAFIFPGVRYIVDCTDLGVEVLPDDYTLPPFRAAAAFVFPVGKFYQREHAFNIVATPRITTKVPAVDAVFTAGDGVWSFNPRTNLRTFTLTVPRPSWGVGDGLKGAFLEGVDADQYCTVRSSTASSITCAIAFDPTGPYRLTEPSCELHGLGVDNYGALTCLNVDSLGIKGIRLHTTDMSGFAFSMGITITGTSIPVLELCDLDGIFLSDCPLAAEFFGCVVRDRAFGIEATTLLQRNCYFHDLPTIEIDASQDFTIESSVFEKCPAYGTRPFDTTDGGWILNLQMVNCQIDGAIVDTIYGTPAYGIVLAGGGNLNLENVAIDNCGDRPIYTYQGLTAATLRNVGGTGNGGPPQWTDGASIQVMDDLTDIGEDSGGFVAGELAAQLWATFRIPAVPRYRRDLDATVPADVKGTGSVVFQK